jgi:hypothetical protein
MDSSTIQSLDGVPGIGTVHLCQLGKVTDIKWCKGAPIMVVGYPYKNAVIAVARDFVNNEYVVIVTAKFPGGLFVSDSVYRLDLIMQYVDAADGRAIQEMVEKQRSAFFAINNFTWQLANGYKDTRAGAVVKCQIGDPTDVKWCPEADVMIGSEYRAGEGFYAFCIGESAVVKVLKYVKQNAGGEWVCGLMCDYEVLESCFTPGEVQQIRRHYDNVDLTHLKHFSWEYKNQPTPAVVEVIGSSVKCQLGYPEDDKWCPDAEVVIAGKMLQGDGYYGFCANMATGIKVLKHVAIDHSTGIWMCGGMCDLKDARNFFNGKEYAEINKLYDGLALGHLKSFLWTSKVKPVTEIKSAPRATEKVSVSVIIRVGKLDIKLKDAKEICGYLAVNGFSTKPTECPLVAITVKVLGEEYTHNEAYSLFHALEAALNTI